MKIFPYACMNIHVHIHRCVPACCQSPSRAALASCGGTRPVHETPLSLYASDKTPPLLHAFVRHLCYCTRLRRLSDIVRVHETPQLQ